MEVERPATRGQQERPTTRWRREDGPMTRDSVNASDNRSDTSVRGHRSEERPISRRGMLSKQVNAALFLVLEKEFKKQYVMK
jgi:hypothetical protein